MSDTKLSTDAVPGKFAEWLLNMGCPVDKVPSVEKLAEMCRGQYYMVWRSLMEKVEAQDVIRNKRLQVFCDDVAICEKKTFVYKKPESKVIVPEELSVWRQHVDLQTKVAEAEERTSIIRQDLETLMEKNEAKLCSRTLSQSRLQSSRRRAWLLQRVAQDLEAKRANLEETKAIADSLCSGDEEGDLQNKLDKCLSSLKQSPSSDGSANSTITNESDFEEQLSSLSRSRGHALVSALCARRAKLARTLSEDAPMWEGEHKDCISPSRVLAETAGEVSSRALEAAKLRLRAKQARAQLALHVAELSEYLSPQACELMVVRCERAQATARWGALGAAGEALGGGAATVAAGGPGRAGEGVDRSIETKRDELKSVTRALAVTEKKLQSVRQCLGVLFGGFSAGRFEEKIRGIPLEMPRESLFHLREFYRTARGKRSRADISLDLDVSETSCCDIADIAEPNFIDELRTYLKKFNLENNRKLVLDHGEKIWIFETLHSSLLNLYEKWSTEEMSCSIVSPSIHLGNNLQRVVTEIEEVSLMAAILEQIEIGRKAVEFDINSVIEEEAKTSDKIKKKLNESLIIIQKLNKTLDVGEENLKIWSENEFSNYISMERQIDGMTYKEYERCYLDNLH